MKYVGSRMFRLCAEGEHARCANYDIFSEKLMEYVDCSCSCHEAAEAAAWRDYRDVSAARRNEFIANVEQVFGGRIGP